MNCILSRAITYHYQGRCPPHKRGSFALFHLFGINSGLFQVVLSFPSSPQPALTCYKLFQVASFATNDDLQNVLTCKFTKNKLYVRYCYKRGKRYYKKG